MADPYHVNAGGIFTPGSAPPATAKQTSTSSSLLSSLPFIGGIFSALGQSRANKQNIALAREQMAFQERMSSTAYQRAATDLDKAGLNRILALGKPSSSPSGQTANVQNVAKDAPAATAATVATALQLKRQNAEIALIESQTRRTDFEVTGTQLGNITKELENELRRTNNQTAIQSLQQAKLTTEQQGLLMQLYRANKSLMLSQQIPLSEIIKGVALAGAGALGIGKLLQLARKLKLPKSTMDQINKLYKRTFRR